MAFLQKKLCDGSSHENIQSTFIHQTWPKWSLDAEKWKKWRKESREMTPLPNFVMTSNLRLAVVVNGPNSDHKNRSDKQGVNYFSIHFLPLRSSYSLSSSIKILVLSQFLLQVHKGSYSLKYKEFLARRRLCKTTSIFTINNRFSCYYFVAKLIDL